MDRSLLHDKLQLQIVGIIKENDYLQSYRLRRHDKELFPEFFAGQSLSFLAGQDLSHTSTQPISSSSTNRHMLQITAPKNSKSKADTWLHSRKVGDSLIGCLPVGQFIDQPLDETLGRNYFCDSSGVVQVLSMIRSNLDLALPCKMNLFLSVQREDCLVYHNYFKVLEKRHVQFQYVPGVEEASSGWKGQVGSLEFKYLKEKFDLSGLDSYIISGHRDFVERVSAESALAGIAAENLIQNIC